MDRKLLAVMRRLVEAWPRHGSERVHEILVGTGWRVNFKRVHRLAYPGGAIMPDGIRSTTPRPSQSLRPGLHRSLRPEQVYQLPCERFVKRESAIAVIWDDTR